MLKNNKSNNLKKYKYISNDFLNFIFPKKNNNITKSFHELSEFQLQPAKNIIYITKNRTTTINSVIQSLVKKNKLDLRIYNGKKFFNITKKILIPGLKFGEYVFTRVNRRHILKIRAQKKTPTIKKK